MADITDYVNIDGLPPADNIFGAEMMEVLQAGVNRRATVEQVVQPLKDALDDPDRGLSLIAYQRKAPGSSARTGEEKADEIFSIEDFGGAGDGVTDNLDSLLYALRDAKGKTVYLKGGGIYKIDQTLEFDGDVSIVGIGSKPAVIYGEDQSFDLAKFSSPYPEISKSLSQNQQIGSRQWSVNDAVGIEPGMLMKVISSADWYFDPRGVTKKSELHRVLLVVGTVVYTEAPAGDGYSIADESVSLSFIKPINFSMKNVEFRMVKSPYGVGAITRTGLIVENAYEPKLISVSTDGCQYTGRFLKECYRPIIMGGTAKGSNAYSTGYGVQFYGCSFGSVTGVTGTECRRVVDISGGVVISRHNTIEFCEAIGGGFNSEGAEYGWAGNATGAYQAGFGTHGASDWTTYRNNKTYRIYNAYTVRGGNEVIENCQHFGRTRNGFIDASFGNNLTVRGNKVFAEYLGKNTAIYDGGGNINSRRADMFIRFQSTFGGGRLQVNDNFAEVQGEFIQVSDPSKFNDRLVAINGNIVYFATSSGTQDVYLVNNIGAFGEYDWRPENNNMRRATGSGAVLVSNNMKLTQLNNLKNGAILSGKWTPEITEIVGFDSASISNPWSYSKNGSMITCVGSITVKGSADTGGSLKVSLPIQSIFNHAGECSGTAIVRTVNPAYDASGVIYASPSSDRAVLNIVLPANVNLQTSVSFSYFLNQ